MSRLINFKSLPVLTLFLAIGLGAVAQDDKYADSYVCQKGMAHFFSATSMENIDATTNVAGCVLNTKTKKVYSKIKQTSFVFKDRLMQEKQDKESPSKLNVKRPGQTLNSGQNYGSDRSVKTLIMLQHNE